MTLPLVSIYVISVWAFWCLLSRRVSDGIIGKVLYMLLVLAALGLLSHPGETSQTALNATFAMIGVRHFWMKTVWPHIRAGYMRRIRCHECPQKGRNT